MVDRLGALISRRFGLVIVLWILLAGGLHMVAPRWEDVTHDGDLAYLPESMPSAAGARLLDAAFPGPRAGGQLAVIVERPDGRLSSADLRWSDSLAALFREHAKDLALTEVLNRDTVLVGDKLTSRPSRRGQATVTVLKVKHAYMATANMHLLDEVQELIATAQESVPDGLNVGISGSAAVAGDMLQSTVESIQNTELTTIALVIVILLMVYRAPFLVLVPLATIGTSLFVSLDVLALLTQLDLVRGFSWWHFKVFTTSKIFIVVILFGSGTDFCLFLISRYGEELERGLKHLQAVAESVRRVSAALVASALTTICGLSMMFFADFGKFRSSGPAIAVCLAIALAACLTLAPALLAAGGKFVFWPFGPRRNRGSEARMDGQTDSRANRFWDWVAGKIVARPGLILLACVAALAPLAYLGSSVRMTYDVLGELAPDRPSVRGAEMAGRHFSPGKMSPVTVLAYKRGGHFNERSGEREIAQLTKALYDMEGIERVRSVTEPTGESPGYFQPLRARGRAKLAARKHKSTRAYYVAQASQMAGEVARFDLVLRNKPFSPQAMATLDQLEAYLDAQRLDANSPWFNAQFGFVGTTVGVRDLADVTASDQRLIQRLVVIAVLAVLLLILRRPLICFYLILSVLFSYLVTIGVTQLWFEWLYGETYYGVDWKVPIFLFVILIAVGEDYNIYLVTRVLEEQRRHGPIAGLRRAVARTGGIITSCGVIMAGTFISMTTGTLRGITELGFALALGIMLDTCVVRPVLVPAFLALLERYGTKRIQPNGDLVRHSTPTEPEPEQAATGS